MLLELAPFLFGGFAVFGLGAGGAALVEEPSVGPDPLRTWVARTYRGGPDGPAREPRAGGAPAVRPVQVGGSASPDRCPIGVSPVGAPAPIVSMVDAQIAAAVRTPNPMDVIRIMDLPEFGQATDAERISLIKILNQFGGGDPGRLARLWSAFGEPRTGRWRADGW